MPAFEVYKPDQAVKSRWLVASSAVALVIYGSYELFYALPEGMRGHAFGSVRPLGEEFPISWALIISIVIAVAGSYGTWRAANAPKLVDFLGETEIEMTKVSWASRREVVGSSLVVIATVVILGVWIALVDIILSRPWGKWIRGAFETIF